MLGYRGEGGCVAAVGLPWATNSRPEALLGFGIPSSKKLKTGPLHPKPCANPVVWYSCCTCPAAVGFAIPPPVVPRKRPAAIGSLLSQAGCGKEARVFRSVCVLKKGIDQGFSSMVNRIWDFRCGFSGLRDQPPRMGLARCRIPG